MKNIRKILLLLVLLISTSLHAQAQLYVPSQQQQQYNQYQQQQQYNQYQRQMTPDQMLTMQDQMMVQQFAMKHPVDYRYTQLLDRISARFNSAGNRVFPNYDTKNVQYIVFVGPFGYNAVAFHQSIVIDSLLMDSLRKLAEGIAFYGKFDTEYTHNLARAILTQMSAMQSGRANINYNSTENPFNLPSPGQLSPQQQQTSAKYFEEMVAGFLSHEGTHAFLEHTKEKMIKQQSLWVQNQGKANPQELNRQINNYISYSFTKTKEFEADAYGVRLLKAAGYTPKGLIYWLELGGLLEDYTGASNTPADQRTHPTTRERVNNINRTWNSL